MTSTGLINLQGVGSVLINDSAADVDFRIESDTNASHFVSDAGAYSGVGAFGFGTTNTGGGSYLIVNPPAITWSTANDFFRVNIASSNAVTISGVTAPIVASLKVNEPNITISGEAATIATTVYIETAPTEGSSNYALFL